MKFRIPRFFYSVRHFITFIVMASIFLVTIILEIVFASINSFVAGYTTLLILSIVIMVLVLTYSFKAPLAIIEYKTYKKNDYNIINNYITKSLEQNLSLDTKNHLRILLLRYAAIYNINQAKQLVKDIYLPTKNTESFQLLYYKAFVEFYLVIGADKKFKETIDSMGKYKVPKVLYNKYQLLYLLLLEDKLREEDMLSFTFSGTNLADNCLSLFAYGIYNRNIGNKEMFEKTIKQLDKYGTNNYSNILKSLTIKEEENEEKNNK